MTGGGRNEATPPVLVGCFHASILSNGVKPFDWIVLFVDAFDEPVNGVTVRLRDNALQKCPGEDMKLGLGFAAPTACACYLSFQGFDADGGRQYSRHPFVVVQAMRPATQTQAR